MKREEATMTLDEAIKHAEEVADTCEYETSKYDMSDSYESHVACQEGKCAGEHRQLAEWLKDYKRLLEQEPCEDAVSRKEIQQKINRLWNSDGDKDYCMETLRDFVTELPSVTPARPKGKWVLLDEESNTWGCTHCKELGKDDWWMLNSGTPKDNKMDSCPHCGADMIEVDR